MADQDVPDGQVRSMDREKDGGPAFPILLDESKSYDEWSYGMSLRDWFAGKALMGLVGSMFNGAAVSDKGSITREAYGWADMMIAEREKS